MKSVLCIQNKLHPLLLEVVELIKNKINSLPDLQVIELEPDLDVAYGNLNQQDLLILNEFYKAKGFRRLHLEVARLGKSLQIFHCVFFPDPCYELPIFGVDLVIVSNNISAAIVDLSPVDKQIPISIRSKMSTIEINQFTDIRCLPSWGEIFSPYVCFVRPVNLNEEKLFLKLIDKYLSILLSLLPFSKPDQQNSSKMIDRLKFQKRYCEYQKKNDKTRTILSNYFSSKWADKYINEILFDC